MTKGLLINDLQLGYAPLSAYAFMKMLEDKKWHQNVSDSHLYIIGQRKEITFNQFNFDEQGKIKFEIWQEGNPNKLRCVLPIFQKHIASNKEVGIDVRLQNRKNTVDKKHKYPFNNTQSIIFQEVNKSGERKHIIWFSPEKLLQNRWKGYIDLLIEGDQSSFLEYRVHYVGKSTEQNICSRLSNHSTFQEILAKEDVLTYGNIPSNEITILLFRVEDNNTIVSWGDEATSEDMSNYLLNYSLPSDKKISLEAEKILIKNMQPGYNKVKFNSYPNKNDLIETDFHNVIMYGITDPIKLLYDDKVMRGSQSFIERDFISIERS